MRLIFGRRRCDEAVLAWSRWRRRHQYAAMLCHYKARGHTAPRVTDVQL
ncbi:hypothetical protein [Alienimonas californiensis]|nr:hypothetical protein [Alienimonas californiensis]